MENNEQPAATGATPTPEVIDNRQEVLQTTEDECCKTEQASRPLDSGIPNVAGYGFSPTGYSIPSQGEYADPSMNNITVSDADI